ncbi:hypothetical protein ACMGDH_15795 [Sphingomonas sp. DT-207]|uniref:hypothetical protein n=1 Tax=Sphingomonas sp. DT-207 TaxID=3396167 RepID=UPI003F19C613
MTLNERLFVAGLLPTFDEALATGDRAALEEMLTAVDTNPGLANVLLGDGYECWFCGNGISREHTDALHIGLSALWSDAVEAPTQQIYAHFDCAHERMRGAVMEIERETFSLDDADA